MVSIPKSDHSIYQKSDWVKVRPEPQWEPEMLRDFPSNPARKRGQGMKYEEVRTILRHATADFSTRMEKDDVIETTNQCGPYYSHILVGEKMRFNIP